MHYMHCIMCIYYGRWHCTVGSISIRFTRCLLHFFYLRTKYCIFLLLCLPNGRPSHSLCLKYIIAQFAVCRRPSQSIHRMAMANFWRTFHHDGKISPALVRVGCTRTPFHYIIEEGRAASKSPHWKFCYFLSVSQQEVSADIIQNSAVFPSSHPLPPLTPCVITEPGRVKIELSEVFLINWQCILCNPHSKKAYVQLKPFMFIQSSWSHTCVCENMYSIYSREYMRRSNHCCCCLYINIFTWKGFEGCAWEETDHLVNLKSKSI